MQKAKERLAEKNRRDKERLQLLEKKKEQERLEKKRYTEHIRVIFEGDLFSNFSKSMPSNY